MKISNKSLYSNNIHAHKKHGTRVKIQSSTRQGFLYVEWTILLRFHEDLGLHLFIRDGSQQFEVDGEV